MSSTTFGGVRIVRGVVASLLVMATALWLSGCEGAPEDPACGCAAAVACGEEVAGRCGSCGCSGSECRGNEVVVCTGTCWARGETCARLDQCVETFGPRAGLYNNRAFCADAADDCEALRAAYQDAAQPFGESVSAAGAGPLGLPGCSDQCQLIEGHCEIGLGACYYVSGAPFDEAPLTRMAMLFEELGCATPQSCDCEIPAAVSCEPRVEGGQSYCVLE